MKATDLTVQERLRAKAAELLISEEALGSALSLLAQSRDFINALDNSSEMDEYIYRSIIKSAADKRKQQAKQALDSGNEQVQEQAQKDLSALSREELFTDVHYRAVLPLVSKITTGEPILRLHAEEAVQAMTELAALKRRHHATSITEVLVKNCREELALLNDTRPVVL